MPTLMKVWLSASDTKEALMGHTTHFEGLALPLEATSPSDCLKSKPYLIGAISFFWDYIYLFFRVSNIIRNTMIGHKGYGLHSSSKFATTLALIMLVGLKARRETFHSLTVRWGACMEEYKLI
jgi:hypothetical protein